MEYHPQGRRKTFTLSDKASEEKRIAELRTLRRGLKNKVREKLRRIDLEIRARQQRLNRYKDVPLPDARDEDHALDKIIDTL